MCKSCSEFAVVGNEYHAGRIAVESPYGVYSLLASTVDKVEYGSAVFRVVGGGDDILRLIEQNIYFFL